MYLTACHGPQLVHSAVLCHRWAKFCSYSASGRPDRRSHIFFRLRPSTMSFKVFAGIGSLVFDFDPIIAPHPSVFNIQVFPKTDDQKQRLTHTLNKSFLFRTLGISDAVPILVDAMQEVNATSGQQVSHGGDGLFVVERGALECCKEVDGISQKLFEITERGKNKIF